VRWVFPWALALAGCGGSVCGNGVPEPGEQCDDGNLVDDDACSNRCAAAPTRDTFVRFQPLIATQFPGFNESCGGLDIEDVEVTVAGPVTRTQRVDCALGQVVVPRLPAGSYTATAVAYDAAGAPLSRGLAQTTFTVGDTFPLQVQLDWPWEDFIRAYTGTFFFQALWAGSGTCAGAAPPVARQRVRLEREGRPLVGMTDAGDPINGAPGACRDGNAALAQFVLGLPWGPAQITLTGEDESGTPAFQATFDTFVGADISNPVMRFDVPSILPDAGVPDAAPADAGP
jgi:cysteine-rich repeat protein